MPFQGFQGGGLALELALHTQVCTQVASAWPRTAGLSKATVDAPGLLNPLAGKPPWFLLPTAFQLPPVTSSPEGLSLPCPSLAAAGLAWVVLQDASSPRWLYTRPAPSRGVQLQPSLLKGGSLTWNEMRLHLPSSTHSGDKHSSISERPRLRQGTDGAVHLANKARGVGEGGPGSRAAGPRWGEGVWRARGAAN